MQVTRDRLLRDFEPQEAGIQLSTQYGSGYPGGELTWSALHTVLLMVGQLRDLEVI